VSTAKRSGLGKGFDALIPKDFDKSLLFDEQESIHKIRVEDLIANSDQPRQYFNKEELEQLADSIKQFGVLQPLVVTPSDGNTYVIVAGERRWRASQMAGLKKVPAIVRTTKELERLEIAIVENVQRVDLSPLEQALSIERLHQQLNMTYETIAKRLSKATSTVNNIVRLLQLPEAASMALQENRITEGHARAILSLKDMPDKQAELLRFIIHNNWSVRQAERYVVSVKEGYKERKDTKKRMQTETPATKKLSKKIGMPVHIRRLAKGGKLEISFNTDEELEKALNLLK
jgi:ParB family chromosome partitioning protein